LLHDKDQTVQVLEKYCSVISVHTRKMTATLLLKLKVYVTITLKYVLYENSVKEKIS